MQTTETNILLIGNTNVGKTVLLTKLLINRFDTEYLPSVTADTWPLSFNPKYKKNTLIWSTPAKCSLQKGFSLNKQKCLAMFDVSDSSSLKLLLEAK